MSKVRITDHGDTFCEKCGHVLVCDENGDMPVRCPCCGDKLSYIIFGAKEDINAKAERTKD